MKLSTDIFDDVELVVIDPVEHPLIGHIGMLQIHDGRVAAGGKDVVPFLRCAQRFQVGFILHAVS